MIASDKLVSLIGDKVETTMLSTIDPDLFVRPDGLPITFVLEDASSPKWSLVREHVEAGGGVLLQESPEEGSWINLTSSTMSTRRSTKKQDVYSIAYLTECISQNTLLPSLEAFAFGLLDEQGREDPLTLNLGLNSAKSVDYEKAIVKTEEVKDEYVEVNSVKEESLEPEPVEKVKPTTVRIVFGEALQKSPTTTYSSQGTRSTSRCASVEEPEPIILKFSKSRGVNVVNRVTQRQQKSDRFANLSSDREDLKEEIVEPSDIQDQNICQHCERTFEDCKKLDRHIDTNHSTKYHNCHHCTEGFRRKFSLQNHIKESHKDGFQECGTCKKLFKLQDKEQTVTNPRSITPEQQDDDYEIEGKSSKKAKAVSSSMYQAMTDLPWKCGECGKTFNRVSNMNMHIKLMHRGIKPKICQVCSETFKTKEQLSRHKLTHPEIEVPFTCKYCSKPFGSVGLMNVHINTIHKAKQFQCDQCQKTFTAASSVLKHKSGVHSSQKAHSCEYCGKLFTQKGSMVYHLKVHNAVKKDESFKCDVCDMDFLRAKLLHIHSKTHRAEKNFKCGKCEYSGRTRQYLQKHEKSHTLRPQQYICSFCDLAYLQPVGLKKHEQMKHGMHKSLFCQYCDLPQPNMSTLKTHMGCHGETPYSCQVCPKSFTNAERRKKHERDEHQIVKIEKRQAKFY